MLVLFWVIVFALCTFPCQVQALQQLMLSTPNSQYASYSSSLSSFSSSSIGTRFRTCCLATKNDSTAAAANNNKKKKNKQAMADHRRFNQQITACNTAKELLQLLQPTVTLFAGGGALNGVNFSTALHRLAKFATLSQHHHDATRAEILADPRFALFLAGLAEYMSNRPTTKCDTLLPREQSNIGWAISKLKVAPPFTVMPPNTTAELQHSAQVVRTSVLQAAKLKQQQATITTVTWIRPLSELAGYMLDDIAKTIVQTEEEGSPTTSRTSSFQMQEYANLLYAWATAGRADPIVFAKVRAAMMKQQQSNSSDPIASISSSSKPQEWSNSIWSHAIVQIPCPDLILFVANIVQQQPNYIKGFKTQELSNTLYGIASLLSKQQQQQQQDSHADDREQQAALTIFRGVAHEIVQRAREFRSQELANSCWSLATVGFGLGSTFADPQLPSLNNYLILKSKQPKEDRMLMEQVVYAIADSALDILPKFRSQELNNLAWSISRLLGKVSEHEPMEHIMLSIGRQLCHEKRTVTAQDIGTTLWSLATSECYNDDLYRKIAMRLTPEMARRANPQELSSTVYAMGAAEVTVYDKDAFDTSLVPSSSRPKNIQDPITAVFGLTAIELMRRPFEFKEQEIKDVLWSFAKVGIRHPDLLKSVAVHLIGDSDEPNSMIKARGLKGFSPQGLGNLAYSFARHSQLADEVVSRVGSACRLANTNGRLAVYTASYVDIGEVLLKRLFAAIAEAGICDHDRLSKFTPQDISNTCYCFSVLGLRHKRLMDAAINELRRRMLSFIEGDTQSMNLFKGQEIANAVWSFATLNMPTGDLLVCLEPYLLKLCSDESGEITPTSVAQIFKRQELANAAWSAAVFSHFPFKLMKLLYTGLVGIGAHQKPSILVKAHCDSGLQTQAIMSLVYVQAAKDLVNPNDGLELPKNFPDGWQQPTSSQHEDHSTDNIELRLSTSKMQRSVSSALTRVGFSHVDEHVITMEELSAQGIHLAAKPLEVLSIDIADLDRKIAIEVDGPAHFISEIDQLGSEDCGFARVVGGKVEYQFLWDGSRHFINGPTALKQRLLLSLGWTTISVPFWEWYNLKGDQNAENEYCRSLVDKYC